MSLLVHVVFTPGTVDLLKYALLSFLKHSSLRLRAVGNGLEDDEFSRLEAVSTLSERLTPVRFASVAMVPHGTILQALFQESKEPLFGFMDSDIFALDELDRPLEEARRGCQIFSSCSNARRDPNQRGVGLGGLATVSPSGRNVAASFFSIYEAEPTRRLMEEYGVGFERYLTPDDLPESVRSRFATEDLAPGQVYDTGKALSLLASCIGLRVEYQNLPELLHLGRMSIARPLPNHPDTQPAKRQHSRPGGAMRDYFKAILSAADRNEPMPQVSLDRGAFAKVRDPEAQMERTRRAGQQVYELVRQLKQEFSI